MAHMQELAAREAQMLDAGQAPTIGQDRDADTGPVGPEQPSRPAEQIGKYEVVGLLGRGGMGVVYQAFDPVLEREVALKVMLPQVAEDPEQKQRFEREARAIARLTHTNVVTVFDLGYHTDGAPYIVMELLKGQDLLHLMHQDPPLSLSRKLSIIGQVLDGLDHAHKVGIVHRDIKPANVSITEGGTAKIMDFGIAHLASTSGTADGSILGTAAYMSPEQARGERVDGRSDLFSVGSLLCELVTGRRPFEADTIVATMYAITHDEPRLRLPEGPEYERLCPVLNKALAKDREARFATGADFAQALAACLGDTSVVSVRGQEPLSSEGDASPAEAEARPGPVSTAGDSAPSSRPAVEPAVESSPRPADPSKLFRLLRDVYVGGKSGHLHFTSGRSCRGLRILEGQIIHGTSDVDGEHLGDVLVRYGVIAQNDREKAVEIVLRERRRLGEVLMSQGLLDREGLEEALGLHVREILSMMLDGPDGSHSFEELPENTLDTDIACRLSTGEVILEATRRVQDPALVRQVLGDTGRVLALSEDPLLRSQRITLTPTDGFLMSRIDGTLSAREVLTLSPVPTEDAERSLFGLLCTGIIDCKENDTASRSRKSPGRPGGRRKVATARTRPVPDPSTRPSNAPPPESTPPPARISTPMPTPTPRPSLSDSDSGRRRAIAEDTQDVNQLILEAHGRLKQDHFDVLGLSRSATENDVKEAYAQFARLLHPDAGHQPSQADMREKRDEVFFRVTAAYETLRQPESRRQYEEAFEPSKLRSPASPSPTPRPHRDPKPDPSPPASPEPAVSASAEPVTAEPVSAAPPLEEPPGCDPAVAIREAEALFAEEAYWDAIQKVEPLVSQLDGPLRTRGVLLLARAYMKNPKWQKRAEEVLLDLLSEDPECSPAYFFLGHIYAGQGLPSRARSMYRKVLDLEPDHRAALGEIAKLEQPAEAPAAGAGLRNWFKGR